MTFKKILEAAQKNLATDIYIGSSEPIYIRTRDAVKPLTKKTSTLSKDQVEQLVDKLNEGKPKRRASDAPKTHFYNVPKINYYKVNISSDAKGPRVHLQVINKEQPYSDQMNTHFLDGFSSMKEGLILLTGGHQSGLTHTLNSIMYMSNIKNENLIGYVAKSFPWVYKNHNSLIYNYEYSDDIEFAIEKALKNNCDQLYIDDLSLEEFEKLSQIYTFDRPTYVTLNFSSILQAMKKLKKSSIFEIISNPLKMITHQKLIFSHKLTKQVPLFEHITPSTKFHSLLENTTLLNTLKNLSELSKSETDEGMITKENYLAQMVKAKLLSSQQAAQISLDPNQLMRNISTAESTVDTDEEIAADTIVSSPPISLDQEWTNIENIPLSDDD